MLSALERKDLADTLNHIQKEYLEKNTEVKVDERPIKYFR